MIINYDKLYDRAEISIYRESLTRGTHWMLIPNEGFKKCTMAMPLRLVEELYLLRNPFGRQRVVDCALPTPLGMYGGGEIYDFYLMIPKPL